MRTIFSKLIVFHVIIVRYSIIRKAILMIILQIYFRYEFVQELIESIKQ
jgi:hypothetical protein